MLINEKTESYTELNDLKIDAWAVFMLTHLPEASKTGFGQVKVV